MKDYKPTVVFDLDGVIHSYRSGYKGPGVIPDPVVPGIAEAIDELRSGGYRVIVVSTRCSDPVGKAAVESYLAENGIAVDGVMAEKPPAKCYVDDRAICFNGNARTLAGKVRSFKSWLEEDPVEFGAMERYTEWRDGHGCGLPGKDCFTRLAEYEDTGLEPCQIDSQFINDVIDENRRLKSELGNLRRQMMIERKIARINAVSFTEEPTKEELERLDQAMSAMTFSIDEQHPANRLRPCKAALYEKGQRYEVTGRFHGWGCGFIEFSDGGPGNFSTAIIEKDDGTVVCCDAETVVFLDREPENEEGR